MNMRSLLGDELCKRATEYASLTYGPGKISMIIRLAVCEYLDKHYGRK